LIIILDINQSLLILKDCHYLHQAGNFRLFTLMKAKATIRKECVIKLQLLLANLLFLRNIFSYFICCLELEYEEALARKKFALPKLLFSYFYS
jgi:hypothetical protein